MDDIELICDDQGLAVIGAREAVDDFLSSQGLASTDLDLPRLRSALWAGGVAAQVASQAAENAGRWVKLTEESARKIKRMGLRPSGTSGLSTGVLAGDKGRIQGFVEFAKGPGTVLGNPAVLAGTAGIMAQFAIQQAMNDISDYLATIDGKVDAILRGQQDAVVAQMIGVELMIDEAMAVRDVTGRVDDVTWSKIQTAPVVIAETQAYALRQLQALADKVESSTNMGDLATVMGAAELAAGEWLAVLACCSRLQDGIAVVELDRVLDSAPGDLDRYRLGLKVARERRRDMIAGATLALMTRVTAAAETANGKVFLHPKHAAKVVASGNGVSQEIARFNASVGIEGAGASVEARRWREAASDVRDHARQAGGDGIEAARRLGSDAADRTKRTAGKVTSGLAARTLRRRDVADED